MPATKLGGNTRKKYITPQEFFEQFSLKKSRGYQILSLPEMQEAIFKTGPKGKKVDLDRATSIMAQLYN